MMIAGDATTENSINKLTVTSMSSLEEQSAGGALLQFHLVQALPQAAEVVPISRIHCLFPDSLKIGPVHHPCTLRL